MIHVPQARMLATDFELTTNRAIALYKSLGWLAGPVRVGIHFISKKGFSKYVDREYSLLQRAAYFGCSIVYITAIWIF